jgi:riboflavin kinase/FMN adenylyltransferase
MIALTIGVFDGVHRGHQAVLCYLRNLSDSIPTVLTFSNHPSEVLNRSSYPLLSSLPLKLSLLKECGVEKTVVMSFTHDLSNQSFEAFLSSYPIRHLVLGEGAAFGKNRLGHAEALREFGMRRGFTFHIVPRLFADQQAVSSSHIRALIAAGRLKEAGTLLDRPYCFHYSPERGFDPHIALPPDGIYPVWEHSDSGIVPTTLTIRHRIPELSCVQSDLLISFGPNLNPTIYQQLCQISPAAL